MPDGPGNAIATLSPDHRVVVADSGHWVTQRRTDVSHTRKKRPNQPSRRAAPATKKVAPAKKKK
jgi:hypothetical protein